MGMAASQAYLLRLTSRLADNELRSQSINNAKMRLATQSAQASDDYINALNDANLMFSNYDSTGTAQSQLLTYNSLTAYSSYNNQYGLVNSSGQLLVSESEAAMFSAANGNLNAYLKAHGLEYTTTYFEELGNIENEAYPVPFKAIESGTLKEWYEAYGSYENSLEVENYTKYYDAYTDATSELNAACKGVLGEYLKYGSNNPKLEMQDSELTLSGLPTGNVVDMLNYYKNAFTGSNGATYNIENLKANGFLTDEAYEAIKAELDSFQTYTYQEPILPGSTTTVPRTGVKVSMSTSISSSTAKDESGNETTTYTIDGEVEITVDANGKVTGVTFPAKELGDPNYHFKTNADGTAYDWTNKDLYEVLNNLARDNYALNDDETAESFVGTTYYETYDIEGSEAKGLKSYVLYEKGDTDKLKEEINSSIQSIYNYLLSDENFNYENFAMAIAGNEPSVSGKVNIPADSELNEIIENYKKAKNDYVEFIFGTDDIDSINQLIRDSKITAKDLQDVDYVLRLVSGDVQDADGNPLATGLSLSENYNTVVKEFIIENMIANTGEPKYAWVDENDTSNNGNADAKAQWYTNMFNRMKQGYKAIENGLASSPEWIEFALESGLVHMEQVDKSFNWKSLNYRTCSTITEETENAEAVAKAEAAYNKAMKDIDAKDSMYDMELKNIDTEHTALQTEYETIKSVITKNVERTFKFSQNG